MMEGIINTVMKTEDIIFWKHTSNNGCTDGDAHVWVRYESWGYNE
jgi:hypothetical protein